MPLEPDESKSRDVPAVPAPSGADRRIADRAPVRLRVNYQAMNSFFADYTKNISKGGTFLPTPRPLALGTRFEFRLNVPKLGEVVLLGEVAWTRGAEVAPSEAGMGIHFLFRDDAERVMLENAVGELMDEELGPAISRGLLAR